MRDEGPQRRRAGIVLLPRTKDRPPSKYDFVPSTQDAILNLGGPAGSDAVEGSSCRSRRDRGRNVGCRRSSQQPSPSCDAPAKKSIEHDNQGRCSRVVVQTRFSLFAARSIHRRSSCRGRTLRRRPPIRRRSTRHDSGSRRSRAARALTASVDAPYQYAAGACACVRACHMDTVARPAAGVTVAEHSRDISYRSKTDHTHIEYCRACCRGCTGPCTLLYPCITVNPIIDIDL